MSKPAYTEFLEKYGAVTQAHSRRTLFDHLWGTYWLLKTWRCEETVCCAGLFHSIYGTNAFKHISLGLEHRNKLRALIGQEAENLVYLFHSTSRPWGWIDAIHHRGTTSRLSGQFLAMDARTIAQLIEIDCANLIEQGGGLHFLSVIAEELIEAQFSIADAAMFAILDASASFDVNR